METLTTFPEWIFGHQDDGYYDFWRHFGEVALTRPPSLTLTAKKKRKKEKKRNEKKKKGRKKGDIFYKKASLARAVPLTTTPLS